MAADITLKAAGTKTTTTTSETVGNVTTQPREVDTEGVETSVDLVDNLAVSAELVASHDTAYREAVLEVSLESSSNNLDGWREVARFDRFQASNTTMSTRQRISFISDRYLRCRWRLGKGASPDKGGVSFSVLGRAVGSAT